MKKAINTLLQEIGILKKEFDKIPTDNNPILAAKGTS
jgi:hypothetical protein